MARTLASSIAVRPELDGGAEPDGDGLALAEALAAEPEEPDGGALVTPRAVEAEAATLGVPGLALAELGAGAVALGATDGERVGEAAGMASQAARSRPRLMARSGRLVMTITIDQHGSRLTLARIGTK